MRKIATAEIRVGAENYTKGHLVSTKQSPTPTGEHDSKGHTKGQAWKEPSFGESVKNLHSKVTFL